LPYALIINLPHYSDEEYIPVLVTAFIFSYLPVIPTNFGCWRTYLTAEWKEFSDILWFYSKLLANTHNAKTASLRF
jgi:hypothetical protein